MNNYCTNCSNKLDKDSFYCEKCGTPIIDLPYNYVYKSPQEKRKKKNIIIFILSSIILVILLMFIYNLKISYLSKNYVEKFIKENFSTKNYTIKYNSSGKCIISGDCYRNLGSGYDQSYCEEYQYIESFRCRSYYFDVWINDEKHIITVFRKYGVYSTVEGINIYGIKEET